jgi:saccharopine dehydrogenase (NAD+, L-lysine-forming)
MMKIGILRETKKPPDKRVPLTPDQCLGIIQKYPNVQIYIQPDGYRAITNDEYNAVGIPLKEDLSDCDILLGVKEVSLETLLPEKTYLFFSHTAKKQPYNRVLLQEILKKKITLVDYEYLTSNDGVRLVAFGRWAGVVGAYNGLRAYGKRYQRFDLKPAWQCRDKKEMFGELGKVKPGKIKILITGGGRVAQGAMETLIAAGIKKVTHDDFLSKEFKEAVYAKIDPWNYVKRLDGQKFELLHFFNFPEEYETTFLPFTKVSDLYIACHFWDPRSPVFMTKEDMRRSDFRIKVIADVSCDINGPIPSTLRPSSIVSPFYGYDPVSESESEAFSHKNITVMAVDNLPGELPRDASRDFGERLSEEVIPYLIDNQENRIIKKASITRNGHLTEDFLYLEDYVKGLE